MNFIDSSQRIPFLQALFSTMTGIKAHEVERTHSKSLLEKKIDKLISLIKNKILQSSIVVKVLINLFYKIAKSDTM